MKSILISIQTYLSSSSSDIIYDYCLVVYRYDYSSFIAIGVFNEKVLLLNVQGWLFSLKSYLYTAGTQYK